MKASELLTWQWNGYSAAHCSRVNLLIHLVAVPVFLIAAISLAAFALALNIIGVVSALVIMVLAVSAEGVGHANEATAPEPFSSPIQAAILITLEQFINFPKFVLTGGWYKAFKAAKT